MPKMSVLLDDDLQQRLEYRARENCRSLSGEIVFILKTYLRMERNVDVDAFKELVGGQPKG